MTDVDDSPFIAPVGMEDDPGDLFPGDRGVLEPQVRRVLVRLLQRRFLLAERNKDDWRVLMDHRPTIESRLGDLYLRVVVDHDRGVAYKEQVRLDDVDVPILLKHEAYSRAETLVLIHLRTVYQRESATGESSARVDVEDVEANVLTYFSDADGATAKRQRAIRSALARLRADGIITEESEGRYAITPIIEVVLSASRLRELAGWLHERVDRAAGRLPLDLDSDDLDELPAAPADAGEDEEGAQRPSFTGPPDDEGPEPDPYTQEETLL